MMHKDRRVGILGEALKGILGMKYSGLETEIAALSGAHRAKEIACLR